MKCRLSVLLPLVVLFALAQSGAALACACCTNTGQRYVENTKFDDFRRSVVSQIRFAKDATLYTDARDLSEIKGVETPSATPYALAVAQLNGRLTFSLRDARNKEGTITLVASDAISVFEVDTRDDAFKDEGLGPLLYKEWRLTAPFSGNGIFQAGNGGYQRVTLILQGRGRGCTEAAHFTHWTLSVYGPLGDYLFYGELAK